MELVLCLAVVLVGALGAAALVRGQAGARRGTELGDARAEAQRWYERLGGQVMNLHGDDPAVRQALADAGERYNAAGSRLEQASTPHQFGLARETALEGLAYIRAARTALGIDPGPEVPTLAAARGVGQLTKEREVDVQGQTFRAGPQPGRETPYYYPGGRYQGRPGARRLVFDALVEDGVGCRRWCARRHPDRRRALLSAFADPGYGYDAGYQEGFGDGVDQGGDGGDQGGDFGGGDQGGGDFGGGDSGGDFGGGGFGGGDFGGGDFGGGDF